MISYTDVICSSKCNAPFHIESMVRVMYKYQAMLRYLLHVTYIRVSLA